MRVVRCATDQNLSFAPHADEIIVVVERPTANPVPVVSGTATGARFCAPRSMRRYWVIWRRKRAGLLASGRFAGRFNLLLGGVLLFFKASLLRGLLIFGLILSAIVLRYAVVFALMVFAFLHERTKQAATFCSFRHLELGTFRLGCD
jgi:hypothetical protein